MLLEISSVRLLKLKDWVLIILGRLIVMLFQIQSEWALLYIVN